jgi:Tfp pilus assembly protein PilF/predicted Zn-dependent protease with MMP-like domain
VAEGGDSDAERAIRDAIAAGDALAWLELGKLFDRREGGEHDAEDAYRAAIDAGDSRGWLNLGNVLCRQTGREDEAAQAYREAIEAPGNPPLNALGQNNLGDLLSRQPDGWPEAEAAYRAAIAGGYTGAEFNLAWMLSKQRGRERDAEEAYRDAIAAGSAGASNSLGWLLSKQPGREAEAEQAYRDAIAEGDALAPINLALLLAEQPGRAAESERICREAIAGGNSAASNTLGWLLAQQPGREDEAEAAYRDALAAGDRRAAVNLGDLLSRRAEREREADAEAEDGDGATRDASAAPEAMRGQTAQAFGGVACGVIAMLALTIGLAPIAVVAFVCAIGLFAMIPSPKERGAWGSSGKYWSMSESEFEELVDSVEHAPASAPIEPRNPDDPLDFAVLISEALDDLPEFMQAELRRNVSVTITDEGAKGHFYGLYVGDTVSSDRHNDRILIARDTLIRDFGHDPDELRRQVTRTVRHELAHHLGADERHVEDLGL